MSKELRVILVDNAATVEALKPLTFTRPVSDLRVGIHTLRRQWELLGVRTAVRVADAALSELFPEEPLEDAIEVDSAILPTPALVALLAKGEALPTDVERITCVPDIFLKNGAAITAQLSRMGRSHLGEMVECRIVGDPSQVHIEEGAHVYCATLNTLDGPIYIGRDATVMEGASLRGPVAICEHATVNMHTKVYPGTTVGPHCKVGGELNNAVFQGYSNKAHDGFLGNAVIGHWCNLGAGCVASNLKNDYQPVRLWSYAKGGFVKTDLQFCGLIMGDHSKAAINTSFNTATTVGVGCNIYGAGFPRTIIHSFTIGGAQGFKEVDIDRMLDTARRVMARRHVELTEADERLLRHLAREAK